MKKKLSFLLLLLTFITAALSTKHAQAALVVSVIPDAHNSGFLADAPPILLSAGMITLVAGVFAKQNKSLIAAGCILMFLDTDGSLPPDAILNKFTKRYPFINNKTVMDDLVNAVKLKYEESKDASGEALIVLDQKEIKTLLEPIELTKEELAKIINDLK